MTEPQTEAGCTCPDFWKAYKRHGPDCCIDVWAEARTQLRAELREAVEGLGHTEKKVWPLTKHESGLREDGYRHICRKDGEQWPCPIVALIDSPDGAS